MSCITLRAQNPGEDLSRLNSGCVFFFLEAEVEPLLNAHQDHSAERRYHSMSLRVGCTLRCHLAEKIPGATAALDNVGQAKEFAGVERIYSLRKRRRLVESSQERDSSALRNVHGLLPAETLRVGSAPAKSTQDESCFEETLSKPTQDAKRSLYKEHPHIR